MAEYVYTLRNVRKAHGDKVVIDNVTLSFLHGAKIGVVGPNGTGKSSLLKIMAGLDQPNNGDGIIDPDATVGMLQQEPPLTEGKTVLENVEEAVADIKGKLDRFANCSCSNRTCCCSTSRPTTWTPRACSGWRATWPPTLVPSWRSPTTATSSTT
jgi:ATPase subunit of ABC transporter with duplicated ATPase domains